MEGDMCLIKIIKISAFYKVVVMLVVLRDTQHLLYNNQSGHYKTAPHNRWKTEVSGSMHVVKYHNALGYITFGDN